MSRELLDESVSATMDGEADELELRRVLAATAEDPELRERWARYQLVRDVMHQQAVVPGLDLASAVSTAIAAEEVAATPPVAARPASSWRRFGRFAVAASVAFAVLAGVRLYNSQDEAAALGPQLAQQQSQQQPSLPPLAAPQGPAVLASYPAPAAVAQEEARETKPDDLLREVPPQEGAAVPVK